MATDKTIGRILKVNHAGEYGAIRIYAAQLLVAKFLHKNLLPFLQQTLSHERNHCRSFQEAMGKRNVGPCQAMPLWGIGGWFLGFSTALLGKNSIMACTAA